MDCSTPGFSVHHHLQELTQTHVHRVSDTIQPTISPSVIPFSRVQSFPAYNLSQCQGLFKWVSSSHQVAKVLRVWASASVLPMNIQNWFSLRLTGLHSKEFSRVFSNITVQKYPFFGTQLSLWSNSHTHRVQFKCSFMSNSQQTRGLQHARLPCPSQLPELAQSHVHWISDALQPSQPLSSPWPPTFNLFQH